MANRKRPRDVRKNERALAHALDELAAFEQFKDEILPELRKDLAGGASAEDIYAKYQSLAAARAITIAAKEIDSGKALAACRDILDRTGGKPKEKHEIEHKLAKMPDEQLDSLLLSELGSVELSEDEEELAN